MSLKSTRHFAELLPEAGASPHFLDGFNRANGGLGANWSTWARGGNTSDGQITSNAADFATASAYDYWNPGTFGPDVEVQVDLGTFSLVRIGLRIANPTNSSTMTGYEFTVNVGGSLCQLYRLDSGGSFNQVGSDFSNTFASNDSILVTAIGSTFKIYRNGTLVTTFTDATYNSAGYIGIGRAAVVDTVYADTLSAANTQYNQTLSASSATAALVPKQVASYRSTSSSALGQVTFQDAFHLILSLGTTASATLVRQVSKTASASQSTVATCKKVVAVTKTTINASVATLSKSTAKTYQASSTGIAILIRQTGKICKAIPRPTALATLGTSLALGFILSTSSTANASLRRQIAKVVTVSTTTGAVASKAMAKTLVVASSPLSLLRRLIGITRSTSSSASATLNSSPISHGSTVVGSFDAVQNRNTSSNPKAAEFDAVNTDS